jgi:hypothetical protein
MSATYELNFIRLKSENHSKLVYLINQNYASNYYLNPKLSFITIKFTKI